MKTLLAASIALVISQAAVAQTLQNGLIAHYEFEGNAKDSSLKGNNNGIERGAMNYKEGIFGYAAEFDGISSYIEVPHNDNQNLKTMTFSAWVYDYEHTSNNSTILTKGAYSQPGGMHPNQRRQYEFLSHASQEVFYLGVYRTVPLQNTPWSVFYTLHKSPVKKWTHVVISYDGAMYRMYLNGLLHGEKPDVFTSFIPQNPDPIIIGAAFAGNETKRLGSIKNGLIDDLRIYNRALTGCEINKLYDPVSYPDNQWKDKICQNQPPTAEFNITRIDPNLRKIQLDATTSQDSDGNIVKYEWLILPDGLTATGRKTIITLPEGGVYEIVLTVTDNKGAKHSKRETYTLDDSDCQGRAKYEVSSQTLQAPYVQVLDATNNVVWIGAASFQQVPNSEFLFNLTHINPLNPPPAPADKVCPATYKLNTQVMKLPFIDVFQTGFPNMTYSGVLKDLDKQDGQDLFSIQNLIRKQ